MKAWVIPTILFCVGLGLGLSGPILATQYMEPYMPSFLKNPLHPLEGIVTHKQRDENRLLMTITTQDGTILATFLKQVDEIDLLVEKEDSITLDVKRYEPFVNDPPVLKVNKQVSQVNDQSSTSATGSLLNSPMERTTPTETPLDSPPTAEAPSEKLENTPPALP